MKPQSITKKRDSLELRISRLEQWKWWTMALHGAVIFIVTLVIIFERA